LPKSEHRVTVPQETLDKCAGENPFAVFDKAMSGILAVSRAEMLRREAEYKAKAALNPHKRGPKPKQSSASPALGGQPQA
jgi:hypothetical protein